MALEVITGPMKSGKTAELICRLEQAKFYGGREFQVFKAATDRRSPEGEIHSFDGNKKLSAIEIASDNPREILAKMNKGIDIVGISEVQFFNMAICLVVQELDNWGKRVIVEGLLLDHQGRPFGPTTTLLSMAGRKDIYFAECECPDRSHPKGVCGHYEAAFSALRPDVSISEGQIVRIGRDDFLVMCRQCFFKHLECRYVEPSMRQFFKEPMLIATG